jgi:hypothetical protein
MGGMRDGLLGTESQARAGTTGGLDVLAAGDPPGVLGIGDPVPLDTSWVVLDTTIV